MNVTWKKEGDGRVYAECAPPPIRHIGFTATDLEAGLKVLWEKPVFDGVKGYQFQVRGGELYYTTLGGVTAPWTKMREFSPKDDIYLPGNLRAMADAKES